ncbi:UvrD-helicase domain-containing protein [Flavobacterium sp. I-STPA6A]|uniref:UvrD-helicase domain-containing protein n=1 Tax=Flavobacterium sp. I-STPA6A TaxID=2590450 RepID=UPI00131B6E75|nr:UvrD-helicase domain-containing protein [Flavobacterium sp. I-STPA6A]
MTAIDNIISLIDQNKSFVLEAGAGSGKTYTLIQTLNYLIENSGADLKFNNQNIVCITYTNVAKNEIIGRIENNPLVIVSTIHEFLWDSIKNYQKQLLIELDCLNQIRQKEKPEKFTLGLFERIKDKEIIYNDSSYRDFENGQIHHDDVITLSKFMFDKYKLLTSILAEKYPYILVDEYQDTANETVSSLIDNLLERNKINFLLGFYGDSYQKIYDTGIGSLENYIVSKKIELVTKPENYRSSGKVVNLLNKIRDNIKQEIPEDKEKIEGSVTFINCDNYPQQQPKEKITDYEKSLVLYKNLNYDNVIAKLKQEGWNFEENSDDKILIIANSRVAERGGFGNLYKIYSTRYGDGATEALMKRENVFTKFFLGSIDKKTSKERKSGVEHLNSIWVEKDYNAIMYFLNSYSSLNKSENDVNYFYLKKHEDKIKISKTLDKLEKLRNVKTVKEVFDFVINNNLIIQSEAITKFIKSINVEVDKIEDIDEKSRIEKNIAFYNSLMGLPYIEFINLFKHTQNHTVFSTKHGTKGEEYRNVLVVIDDTSWKQKYNFEKYFNNTENIPERALRTKNLFYVSCSRAKENLVVLALSEMDKGAINRIESWFKTENVFLIDNYTN